MAQLTSTTLPGMQQAAGAMQNAIDTTRNGVGAVEGATAQLKSVWAGEAGSSFDYAMQAWVSDCQAINQALGQMVELLQGNAVVIGKGEQSNADAAAQVHKVTGMHL
jgi:WXG100 family type VII secretion target